MANEQKKIAVKDVNSKPQPALDNANTNVNSSMRGRVQRNRPQEKIPFSNPQIEMKFTLKTQEAIRMFQRHFFPTSQFLFNIMINCTRLERLGQRGASGHAKKFIDAALDIPAKEIDIGIKAFSEMLKEAGEVLEVQYTNPRDYDTAIRTPEATRLINLFKRYDHVITLLDKAYLNALAPAEEVDETKTRLSANIQALAKAIKTHAQASVDQLANLAGKPAVEGEVPQTDKVSVSAEKVNSENSQSSAEV
ncbi:hypothetical protein ACI0X9_003965 [Cronobacter turicensis]